MFNMACYMSEIEKECLQEIKECKKELTILPTGSLVKRSKEGCAYYSHIEDGIEKGISKDSELIHLLARKRYLKVHIKILNSNLKGLLRLKKSYQSLSPDEIIGQLANTYRELPTNTFFKKQKDEWNSQPYETNAFKKDQ